MNNINIKQLKEFHNKIVQKTGGATGVRELNLLISALSGAEVTFDGKDLYENKEKKIAAITFGLISNHGFVDGNKRIGVSTLLLLCKINNIILRYSQNELIELGIKCAKGTINQYQIYKWIIKHTNYKI